MYCVNVQMSLVVLLFDSSVSFTLYICVFSIVSHVVLGMHDACLLHHMTERPHVDIFYVT